ncbi:TPA: hypothetical protein ACXDAZ_002674 [Clostridium botulinum]
MDSLDLAINNLKNNLLRNYMDDLIGEIVKIGDKEGKIVDILGWEWCKIEFFNIRNGETRIHITDIEEYLI